MEPIESPVRTGDAGHLDAVTGPMLRWIAAVDRTDALDRYAADAAAVVAVLMDTGAGAVTTSRTLTSLHDALTVRLIELASAELGPPPCPYAWLALGSGGRMEQSLCTDQDHAVVYTGAAAELAEPTLAGAPGGTAGDAADYFTALGTRVVAGLARAGLRRCPGGYMADRWHMPSARWRELFHGWVDSPVPQALVDAELFLDFRRVHGELSTASLDAALRKGSGAPRFLVGMARAAVRFPPPLRFGRIRDGRGFRDGRRIWGGHGEVDLKRGGLAGVVLLARLYALSAGSLARSTLDRLAAASAAGVMSAEGAASLADAYRCLVELRVRTQLRQVAVGDEPTNRVRLDDLAADERRRLRRAFRAVRDMQHATELRFHTHTVL